MQDFIPAFSLGGGGGGGGGVRVNLTVKYLGGPGACPLKNY